MKFFGFTGLAFLSGVASICGAENNATQTPLSPAAVETAVDADDPFFWGLQWIVPAKGFYQYRTPADIAGGDGRLSSSTAGAEIAARFLNAQNIFYGAVDYRYTDYRFSGTPAAFSDTESLHGFVRYVRLFDENWGGFVDLLGRMASEKKAHLSDGCTWRIGGGARYAVSKDLTFYFGVQAASRLEDNVQWLPYIGIEWQIDSHWSLNITNGLVVTYNVFEDASLRVDFSCTYASTDFRLRDENTGFGRRSMALKSQEVPLTVSVTQELGKYGYIRGMAGAIVFSQYDFEHDGDSKRKFKTDPAAIFGIEAGLRF